jgi:hypothetical protein
MDIWHRQRLLAIRMLELIERIEFAYPLEQHWLLLSVFRLQSCLQVNRGRLFRVSLRIKPNNVDRLAMMHVDVITGKAFIVTFL